MFCPKIFVSFFFAVPFFVVAVVFAVVCPFTLRYGTQLLCFSPVRLALFSFFFLHLRCSFFGLTFARLDQNRCRTRVDCEEGMCFSFFLAFASRRGWPRSELLGGAGPRTRASQRLRPRPAGSGAPSAPSPSEVTSGAICPKWPYGLFRR